jgi:hypothetical protein
LRFDYNSFGELGEILHESIFYKVIAHKGIYKASYAKKEKKVPRKNNSLFRSMISCNIQVQKNIYD